MMLLFVCFPSCTVFVVCLVMVEFVYEFFQHMDNKELTRRIATGTLHSTTVMARTIMNLSTDPNKAVKKAQVIIIILSKSR